MFNRLFERKKEKVVKACNECKYYKKISNTYGPNKCYCPALVQVNICYVTGEEHIVPRECSTMRLFYWKCGPEGKYWERKGRHD